MLRQKFAGAVATTVTAALMVIKTPQRSPTCLSERRRRAESLCASAKLAAAHYYANKMWKDAQLELLGGGGCYCATLICRLAARLSIAGASWLETGFFGELSRGPASP